MAPTVQVGTILMKGWPGMTQLLGLESEPCSGEWNLLKVLDGLALDRKIHAAGWNFFFMAGEVKVMFFGSVGAAWMSTSTFHGTGISFDNGYQSEGLAHILGFVMQHQDAFVLPPNLGRQGLLQISTPTLEESTAATVSVNHAFDCLGSVLAEPALA
jgi:hypothetical protein